MEYISYLMRCLDAGQRIRFWRIQLFVVLTAILEVVAVAIILQFSRIILQKNNLNNDTMIVVQNLLPNNDHSSLILYLGLSLIILLGVSSVSAMITTWKLAVFANEIGASFSKRLYLQYLEQSWIAKNSEDASAVLQAITIEVTRVTNQVILPLLLVNARIILVIFITTCLAFINLIATISILLILLFLYFTIFTLVRKTLQNNSYIISAKSEARVRTISETVRGYKELLLYGDIQRNTLVFEEQTEQISECQAKNLAIANVPRNLIELLALSSLISAVIYFSDNSAEADFGVMATLSTFIFATLKILPALQQSYAYFSAVKGNFNALVVVNNRLMNVSSKSQVNLPSKENTESNNTSDISSIELQSICFSYDKIDQQTLKNISITAKKGSPIGIIGPTGSGKSTLLYVLLGLLGINSGTIKINNKICGEEYNDFVKDHVSYVSQDIFLLNDTILENITYNQKQDEVDYQKALECLRQAALEELCDDLDFVIGENGRFLSGGQRQRLTIARALYKESQIFIFDEATSALDPSTENKISQLIKDLAKDHIVIVIAHRMATINDFEKIYFLEHGKITASGSFLELRKKGIISL